MIDLPPEIATRRDVRARDKLIWLAIANIAEPDGLRMEDIAAGVGIPLRAAWRCLKRLEASGLVQVHRGPFGTVNRYAVLVPPAGPVSVKGAQTAQVETSSQTV